MMSSENRLAVERECARLIWLYAYLNDERRFKELANLFAEDARLYRPSAPDEAILGRPAILEAFASRPVGTLTFHVCTDVVIEVESPIIAVGHSRLLLLSTSSAESARGRHVESRKPVPGRFRDRFVLTDAGWRFAERRSSFWT